ncbi:unnamed protein product [Rhizoctonia solani]|uniref:WW domain-containing protein n=1 Tax=Rhizoctonia solani TaxID=456999 RepID=A0A8H3CTG8_9AGAM|nr:unnamed protein product [Rhizoctonia solani]
MSAPPEDKSLPQPDNVETANSTERTRETEDEQATVAPEKGEEDGTSKNTDEKSGSEGKDATGPEQTDAANPPLPDEPLPPQSEWQAIWSPAHNAYYFFNARTNETTWVNPLDPSASTASTSAPQVQTQPPTEPEPKETTADEKPPPDLSYLGGIDPELAYLDPTLAVPSAGSKGPVPTFSARFGARDGKFTAMDGRRPEHLSEAARAQRMGAVYYDTEAWEREIAERDAKAKADAEAGVGDKRKRVTKADIERFKEQKKAKKAMRNAWLRD